MTDNIDYGAVFGVTEELAAAEGEKEQEPAAPATGTEEAQGEKEQEAAAPAGDHDTETQEEEAEGEEKPAGGEAETKPAQSPEERARFAAARRKAEQERDAAIEKARQDAQAQAQQQLDAAIKALGLINPYTKQPIQTKAEFDSYQQKRAEEKRNNMLQKSGMSREEFSKMVEELPEVQQARAAKQQADAMLQRVRQDNAKARMDEQLKQIQALDPSIQSINDLAKADNYQEILDRVKGGYSILDAFKLANFDKLQQRTVMAAKQAAVNAAQGKAHLQQTQGRGAGAASVPENVKAEYRMMMPGITDDEIQKHWNNYQNSQK